MLAYNSEQRTHTQKMEEKNNPIQKIYGFQTSIRIFVYMHSKNERFFFPKIRTVPKELENKLALHLIWSSFFILVPLPSNNINKNKKRTRSGSISSVAYPGRKVWCSHKFICEPEEMEKPHPKFQSGHATASHCFNLNQVTKLSTYSDVFIGVACACACDDWHGHLSSEKQRAHP